MRYLLFIFVFALLFSVLHAQPKGRQSLVIGIDYLQQTSKLSYYNYDNSPHGHFRVGTDIYRQISPRISFRTGVRITNISYDSGVQPLVTTATLPVELGGMGLAVDPVYGPTMRRRIEDFYAELPFVFRYQSPQHTRFYVEGGFATYVYLTSYSITESWQKDQGFARIVSDDHFRPLAQVAAGWLWNWQANKQVFVQPTLRYLFERERSGRGMAAGVEMGVRW